MVQTKISEFLKYQYFSFFTLFTHFLVLWANLWWILYFPHFWMLSEPISSLLRMVAVVSSLLNIKIQSQQLKCKAQKKDQVISNFQSLLVTRSCKLFIHRDHLDLPIWLSLSRNVLKTNQIQFFFHSEKKKNELEIMVLLSTLRTFC